MRLAAALIAGWLLFASPPGQAAPQKPKPATPLANPGSWVTSEDYPDRAIREEREGTTAFVLEISAEGVPTHCQVSVSSGHDDLDVATCVLIQSRARFEPATNRRGRPVPGSYANRVHWQIPGDSVIPNRFVDGSHRISFTIRADGRPTDCSASLGGNDTPCSRPGLRFEPFRDANGNPVARRVWITNYTRIGPAIATEQGADAEPGQHAEPVP